MEKSFWVTRVVYNKDESCFDLLGADIVYSKGDVGSLVDNVSCEKPMVANEPAVVFIYTNPELFPLLETAGLKRLPSTREEIKNSILFNTTKLRRIAKAVKNLDYGKYTI